MALGDVGFLEIRNFYLFLLVNINLQNLDNKSITQIAIDLKFEKHLKTKLTLD
jgi:hypothetical protein